jgi:pilus assembly protein CpaB
MSPTPPAPAADAKFGLGLMLGLAGACLAGLVITVPVGFIYAKGASRRGDDRGWNLVPVVVYAVDVKGGEPLTFDQISQRSIPEKFADPSVVKPDSASFIINQKVVADAKAGDFVRWVDVAPKEAEKCFAK